MTTTVTDIDTLVEIDQRITASWEVSLRARWEFGQLILAARGGAGRLPNLVREAIVKRVGISPSELANRARFAAAYPEQELANAAEQFDSWRELVKALYADAPRSAATPQPVPDGKFATT